MKQSGKLKIIFFFVILLTGLGLFLSRELWLPKNNAIEGMRTLKKNLPGFEEIQQKVSGQMLLVHFWAKWCAPCKEEMPHLIEFARALEKQGLPVSILAISLDSNLEESKTILPQGGADLPKNFLLFLDSEQKLAQAFGSFQFPETYLLSKEGQTLHKWVGPQKWEEPALIQVLKDFTAQ